MTRIVGIIPARMGSSRFPGKPLARILGLPMIEHVYRRAVLCKRLDGVFVATCDDAIKTCIEDFDGQVIMTSNRHERASDRTAEAADQLDAGIVVMIQGDEPMITPRMIELALRPMLDDASVGCVNLACQFTTEEECLDRNTIKVVTDLAGNALSFSRAPIPSVNSTKALKQVCIIPFRSAVLRHFAALQATPLERSESIDMLRLIENGYPIRIVETDVQSHAVDTPEDLQLVETLLRQDSLIQQYMT